jgi:nucleoside-triphosphatase THEP1
MRTITKNLNKYKWIYSNKSITIQDKTTGQLVVLDKVGFMSLSRFILRSLDTMRIDEIKKLRLLVSNYKEDNRENLKKNKPLLKLLQKTERENQKAIAKQAKEESRHSMGGHSEVNSGEQV